MTFHKSRLVVISAAAAGLMLGVAIAGWQVQAFSMEQIRTHQSQSAVLPTDVMKSFSNQKQVIQVLPPDEDIRNLTFDTENVKNIRPINLEKMEEEDLVEMKKVGLGHVTKFNLDELQVQRSIFPQKNKSNEISSGGNSQQNQLNQQNPRNQQSQLTQSNQLKPNHLSLAEATAQITLSELKQFRTTLEQQNPQELSELDPQEVKKFEEEVLKDLKYEDLGEMKKLITEMMRQYEEHGRTQKPGQKVHEQSSHGPWEYHDPDDPNFQMPGQMQPNYNDDLQQNVNDLKQSVHIVRYNTNPLVKNDHLFQPKPNNHDMLPQSVHMPQQIPQQQNDVNQFPLNQSVQIFRHDERPQVNYEYFDPQNMEGLHLVEVKEEEEEDEISKDGADEMEEEKKDQLDDLKGSFILCAPPQGEVFQDENWKDDLHKQKGYYFKRDSKFYKVTSFVKTAVSTVFSGIGQVGSAVADGLLATGNVGGKVVKVTAKGACKTVKFLAKVVMIAGKAVLLPVVIAAGVVTISLPVIRFAGGVVLLTLKTAGTVASTLVNAIMLPIKIAAPVVIFTVQIGSVIVMVAANFIKEVAFIAAPTIGYAVGVRILLALAKTSLLALL